jgi:hypothetical protein
MDVPPVFRNAERLPSVPSTDALSGIPYPRNKPQRRPRFSRNTVQNVLPDDEAPLIG